MSTQVALAVLAVASVLALWLLWHQAFALIKQPLIQRELQRAVRERLEWEVAQRTTQLTALALHLSPHTRMSARAWPAICMTSWGHC